MKISQAFKLGHRSIMGHKRRNLTTIIIIGLIFGLLSGIIFVLQGTENALLRAADETYGESYYVGAMTNVFDESRCRREPIPDQPNTANIICPPGLIDEAVSTIESYGGTILAKELSFSTVLSPDSLPSFIPMNLDNLPDDAVAVATNPDRLSMMLKKGYFHQMTLARQAAFIRDELPSALGTTVYDEYTGPNHNLYIAGLLPAATIRDTNDTPGMSLNPFDMVLDFLGMRSGSGVSTVYLDVDSPASQEEIEYLRAQSSSWADNMATFLIQFDDAATAERFSRREVCGTMGVSNSSDCHRPLMAGDSFDNRLSLQEVSRFTWGILRIVELAVIVIVAIIMFFTFLKVLGDQTSEVRLYRSLGASTFDICLIYGAYLVEVCLYTIIFMLILGLAVAGLTSLLNATAFSDVLTVAYSQTFAWPKILIGWNPELLRLVRALFLVAALSLLWFILTKKYQPRRS